MVLAHGGTGGEWNRVGSSGKEEITTGRPPPALTFDNLDKKSSFGMVFDPNILIAIQRVNQVDNVLRKVEIKKLSF